MRFCFAVSGKHFQVKNYVIKDWDRIGNLLDGAWKAIPGNQHSPSMIEAEWEMCLVVFRKPQYVHNTSYQGLGRTRHLLGSPEKVLPVKQHSPSWMESEKEVCLEVSRNSHVSELSHQELRQKEECVWCCKESMIRKCCPPKRTEAERQICLVVPRKPHQVSEPTINNWDRKGNLLVSAWKSITKLSYSRQ